ncbi:MAG: cell division protein CrgA [Actinomycetota bacterium]|nr:cell division protein CrgA [Actinomycetota bacterium]
MPRSRHRRKGRPRPRPQQAAGPPVKPKPSPRWVPIAGLTLVGLGLLVVLVNYLPGLFESNWLLLAGFALMTGGFILLTTWR